MPGEKTKEPGVKNDRGSVPSSSSQKQTSLAEIKHTPRQKKARRSGDRGLEVNEKPSQESIGQVVEPGSNAARGSVLPIVGIGASAGGLEAIEKFFNNMPSDSGMAFVLIQHLDPTHKSILTELVKRYTQMNVFEVENGMPVEANCAYVIPPNRDMAILHGKLHLMEPNAPRGLRLPIDYFFRSLAEDQGERAVGIVLSGTGTEGAQGIRAIKGEGGMAMVQDPVTAKYDGMPRNAIATGFADFILPPEEMPQNLVHYVQHAFGRGALKLTGPAPKTEKDLLSKIFILLRSKTGHDFSHYKQNTIGRRIARRMTVHQITPMGDYVRFLQQNPQEVDTLFKDLLIGVTNFFRDPEAWAALREKVIPRMFEGHTPDKPVRVWVPGCSTGEEAYSLTILLQEYLDENKLDIKLQIFATDIDSEAIEKARTGIFPESIAVDVSQDRLLRFFKHEEHIYQVKRSIRDLVVFAVQNVAKDPPFSMLDLVSCRNLLIYMEPELQKRILPLFHYALNQNGFLFLGNSESIGEFVDLYATVDRKWKIYRCQRINTAVNYPIEFSFVQSEGKLGASQASPAAQKVASFTLRELVESTMLKRYTPTGVIVNEKGEVLYVHGNAGRYLELPSGETSLNIVSLARDGLRSELANALRRLATQKQEVRYEQLHFTANDTQIITNLTVTPVPEPEGKRGLVMIVFEDIVSRKPQEAETVSEQGIASDDRIVGLERELRAKEEFLQTTIEELETSNEELKSTNEELQSSNEELQSTNEELETSKEELQSVNEELVTVNVELQKKIELLSQSNNDMNNLLASTEVGTVFLDQHLRIQRFTPAITQIIPLIQSDIGRPISDITTNLVYNRLAEDVDAVLRSLVFKENEVHTTWERWYRMRIMPYRTLENVIDGVVITFINITEQKQLQFERDKLKRAVEINSNTIMITDGNGVIEYIHPKFAELTGYSVKDTLGIPPRLLRPGDPAPEFFRQMWETLAAGETWVGKFHNMNNDGPGTWVPASISPVKDESGKITYFIAAQDDFFDRSEAREKGQTPDL